ncbi:hypothetical protein ISN75_18985 [Dyella marensis]|uniref:YtxH domain-containing protein n=1 Tax=Dyella marensis TaxID=500610 RepID=UPI0031D214FE
MSLHERLNSFLTDATWASLISLLGGAMLGAFITWLFARASSKELRSQIAELKQQALLAPRMLELKEQGAKVGLNRDQAGQVIGLKITETLKESITGSASLVSGTLETVKPSDSMPPAQ